MKRAIVTPAVLAGIALDELKHWLSISNPSEDALLGTLLRGAIDLCEAFTGSMPLETECEEILPVSRDWQSLATRPVHSITGVEAIPRDAPPYALPLDSYQIDLGADGSGLIRVSRLATANRVAVRFTAGLSPDWDGLPEGIRHGIIRLAAHHYRSRDAASSAQTPAAVAALWRPWRRMRIA